MASSDSTFVKEFENCAEPEVAWDETNNFIDADSNRGSDHRDILQNFQTRSDDILRKYSEKVINIDT